MVDECHKATGKADIVLAIRKMANDSLKFRIIGLSATPGRDRKAIQVSLYSCQRLYLQGTALVTKHAAPLDSEHPEGVYLRHLPAVAPPFCRLMKRTRLSFCILDAPPI